MIDENSIRLIRLTHSSELTHEFRTIYEEAFPPDERREWLQIIDLLSNPSFNFLGIYDLKRIIGLLSVWNLDEFHFVEHFAIQDIDRGKGFGNQVIQQLQGQILTPIILEVEEPFTEMAQKRVAFYKRLNFHVCDLEYYQPPYSISKTCVKMLLMSFPVKLFHDSLIQIKARIYDSVYHFTAKS
jgi:hypothetical protein